MHIEGCASLAAFVKVQQKPIATGRMFVLANISLNATNTRSPPGGSQPDQRQLDSGLWAPRGKYELAAGVRVSDVPPIRQVNEAQITVRPQGGHHRPPQATVSHPVQLPRSTGNLCLPGKRSVEEKQSAVWKPVGKVGDGTPVKVLEPQVLVEPKVVAPSMGKR